MKVYVMIYDYIYKLDRIIYDNIDASIQYNIHHKLLGRWYVANNIQTLQYIVKDAIEKKYEK